MAWTCSRLPSSTMARKDRKLNKNMFLAKSTERAMFNASSLSDPLVGVDSKAAKPSVPLKPKVERCNGCEVPGPFSN